MSTEISLFNVQFHIQQGSHNAKLHAQHYHLSLLLLLLLKG